MNCVCGHFHVDNCLCGCTIYTPDTGDNEHAKLNFGTAWRCPADTGPQPKNWREVEVAPVGYFPSLARP
jgi:hypothetical protein